MTVPDEITSAEQARELAIKWQHWQSTQAMSYDEMFIWNNYFVELAERFDLTEEFVENGII